MSKPHFEVIDGEGQDSDPEEDQARADDKKEHPSNSTNPDWTGTPEPSLADRGANDNQPDQETQGPVDLSDRIKRRKLGRHYWGDK